VDTGFPKRSCSNKKIERDDDSKKSHHALPYFRNGRGQTWTPLAIDLRLPVAGLLAPPRLDKGEAPAEKLRNFCLPIPVASGWPADLTGDKRSNKSVKIGASAFSGP
jgi:hypothetical protein